MLDPNDWVLVKSYAALIFAGGICPHCRTDLKNSRNKIAYDDFVAHVEMKNEREEWLQSLKTLNMVGGK